MSADLLARTLNIAQWTRVIFSDVEHQKMDKLQVLLSPVSDAITAWKEIRIFTNVYPNTSLHYYIPSCANYIVWITCGQSEFHFTLVAMNGSIFPTHSKLY